MTNRWVWLGFGILAIGIALHDLIKGQVTLSFADYSRTERPVMFYIYTAFPFLAGILLVSSSLLGWP